MIEITKPQQRVLQDALSTFGRKNQYDKAIEEIAELNLEIIHGQRKGFNEEAIVGEIADCLIILTQLAIIHGVFKVQNMVDFKINRLQDRIIDFKELDH